MSEVVHLARDEYVVSEAADKQWCWDYARPSTRKVSKATCADCLRLAAEYGEQCRQRLAAVTESARVESIRADHPDPTCDMLHYASGAECTCNVGDDVPSLPQAPRHEATMAGWHDCPERDKWVASSRARFAAAVANADRREAGGLTEEERAAVASAQKVMDEYRATIREQGMDYDDRPSPGSRR